MPSPEVMTEADQLEHLVVFMATLALVLGPVLASAIGVYAAAEKVEKILKKN